MVVILHQNLSRAILLSVIPTQHGLLSRSFPTLGSVVSLHLASFPDPRDGKPGNEACLRHTLHMIGVRNLNLLNGSRTSNQKTSVTVTLGGVESENEANSQSRYWRMRISMAYGHYLCTCNCCMFIRAIVYLFKVRIQCTYCMPCKW